MRSEGDGDMAAQEWFGVWTDEMGGRWLYDRLGRPLHVPSYGIAAAAMRTVVLGHDGGTGQYCKWRVARFATDSGEPLPEPTIPTMITSRRMIDEDLAALGLLQKEQPEES